LIFGYPTIRALAGQIVSRPPPSVANGRTADATAYEEGAI
jgi:hypothetical protein